MSLLTGLDKLGLADFTVAPGADSVHSVRIGLSTVDIREVTHGVHCLAHSHYAVAVHPCGHVVEGFVGGLPGKADHIAGAFVLSTEIVWSTGDWR